jgi:hypothetical protein
VIDDRIASSFPVAKQLGLRRPETGAAVQVGHLADVPGILRRRHSGPRGMRFLILA